MINRNTHSEWNSLNLSIVGTHTINLNSCRSTGSFIFSFWASRRKTGAKRARKENIKSNYCSLVQSGIAVEHLPRLNHYKSILWGFFALKLLKLMKWDEIVIQFVTIVKPNTVQCIEIIFRSATIVVVNIWQNCYWQILYKFNGLRIFSTNLILLSLQNDLWLRAEDAPTPGEKEQHSSFVLGKKR